LDFNPWNKKNNSNKGNLLEEKKPLPKGHGGKWTDAEHLKFLYALLEHGKDWNAI
jgi:hypothetical protein